MRAAALAKVQFGVTDRRTLHVEYLLAKEADELGRVRDARLRLQDAIEAFESGPNRDSPEEVQALAWLAGLDERIGESAQAIDIGNKALALARRVLPDDSDALTEAVLNLGWILMDAVIQTGQSRCYAKRSRASAAGLAAATPMSRKR